MPGRGVVNIAGTHKTYFFHGDQYAQIEWHPGRVQDSVWYGPAPLYHWQTFKQAGFNRIDAVLPIQGYAHRAYFFSGDKYQRIDYVPDSSQEEAIGAVRSISDNWESLRNAGFNHVDAVLNVPGATNETYFFCDNKYIRASWHEGYGGEKTLEGPKYIAQGWGMTGFDRFDMVLPHPTISDHAYIFSEHKYVQVKVVPGGEHQLISDQRPIGNNWWPSLHSIGFDK
ncbi:unnamed protein product [Rhizoctonia solani]|uniref:Hemopexin n=1 Tax=Rhizoctonia solani TaxID=456999 RepID=A0A8H3B9D3_9AGAM|nr:unnamed protein product [Rhizoctonia solani]